MASCLRLRYDFDVEIGQFPDFHTPNKTLKNSSVNLRIIQFEIWSALLKLYSKKKNIIKNKNGKKSFTKKRRKL